MTLTNDSRARGTSAAVELQRANVAAGICVRTRQNGDPHGPVSPGSKMCEACRSKYSRAAAEARASSSTVKTPAPATVSSNQSDERHGAQGDPAIPSRCTGHETALVEPYHASGTANLTSGSGTLTLTISVDLFSMSTEDRAFVFGLIDRFRHGPVKEPPPSPSSSAPIRPSVEPSSSSPVRTSDAAPRAPASTAPVPPTDAGAATPTAPSSSGVAAASVSESVRAAPSVRAVAPSSTPASTASTSNTRAERLAAIRELEEERRREKRERIRNGRGSFGLGITRPADEDEEDEHALAARPYSPGMSIELHSTVEINPKNITEEP